MSDQQTNKGEDVKLQGGQFGGHLGELECGDGVYMILIDYIYVWNSLEKKETF